MTIDPDIRTAFNLCLATYGQRALPVGAVTFRLPLGKKHSKWSTDGETIGFVCEIDGIIWRAWKGSTTPFDWLEDSKAEPDSTGVHSGVAEYYADAVPMMIQAMQHFPSGLPIRDTGHSLGGGAADLSWADTPNGLQPITFEALRVFTTARAKSLPKDGIRIVNERDIVPHLPGRAGLWNYEHRALALRFVGNSLAPATAHSLIWSVGPALDGKFPLEGPLELS